MDSWFASKPEQAHASKEGKNNSGNSNEDPYENFRKEIVKIKGKEKIST
ncbi:hypothetical protein LEP1GSC151_4799 [Leptospira interrogans serovar Grippotyphosa str. LT2186]|uniref:Uncharacterized protein n=3 Tax=Leptospira interrogans TaxID=173 RepID=M3I732_LEPIR|nr:hypothetical protein LEP1GSC067_0179 [Leptospira interrogans serovar Lora str. TE 1992]EMG11196.1 hypothetical protein LEP1GSC151_4799 [Leptospira interrogans serovar Grippotyphosa str. LT2186]EMN30835.1 hypothetical protein LEP1GSC083_3458 [Leptospira interrogans serovar Pyrogenes str. L0374]